MLAKIFLILSYTLYAAILYTAYTPNHAYVEYLENAKYLYILLHIPIYLVFSFFSVFLFAARSNIAKEMKKIYLETSEIKKARLVKSYSILNSTSMRVKLFLNRIILIAVGITSFVIMGDHFFGSFVIFGVVLGVFFINIITDLSKEMFDDIK